MWTIRRITRSEKWRGRLVVGACVAAIVGLIVLSLYGFVMLSHDLATWVQADATGMRMLMTAIVASAVWVVIALGGVKSAINAHRAELDGGFAELKGEIAMLRHGVDYVRDVLLEHDRDRRRRERREAGW